MVYPIKNYISVALVFFTTFAISDTIQASLLDFFAPAPNENATQLSVTGSPVNTPSQSVPAQPPAQSPTSQPSQEPVPVAAANGTQPFIHMPPGIGQAPPLVPPAPVTTSTPPAQVPALAVVPATPVAVTTPAVQSTPSQPSAPIAPAPVVPVQASPVPVIPSVPSQPVNQTVPAQIALAPVIPPALPIMPVSVVSTPIVQTVPPAVPAQVAPTSAVPTILPVPVVPTTPVVVTTAEPHAVPEVADVFHQKTDEAGQPVAEIIEHPDEQLPAPGDIPHAEVGEIATSVKEFSPHRPLHMVDEEEQDEVAKEYHKRIAQSGSSRLARSSYLGSYLEPWKNGPDEKIELLFENAELTAFITYIEQKFGITFILDDAIKPPPQGGKSLTGIKMSFRTHTPLTKRQVWDIFIMFLDMAGVAPVPGPIEGVYRLVASKNHQSVSDATHGPLPILSGVDESLIPNNDMLIRYVYFVSTANPDTIIKAVDTLRSIASPPVIRVPEVNALIITDRALNIKTMLKVIGELDRVDGHEGLAVIKLHRADAIQAAKLYEDFSRQDSQQSPMARLIGARKASTTEYFERGARVIPEPRTNSLIVLGSRGAIEVIVEFVKNIVERIDERPEAPQYIYRLKFQSAEALATLLREAVKFSTESSSASNFGGVRDGNKYLKPISIVEEKTTNSLIITADYDDYMHLYDLIKSLDVEQPQVAIRMFILNISVGENKGFGAQIRNKVPGINGLLGNNVNFQTSGLTEVGSGSGIVENSDNGGMVRLLGNLVSVASSAAVGSTIVQLGSDIFGVWGLLNMLEKYTKVNVVENPFLVTTNKYPAHFAVGETRRVVDANVFTAVTQSAFKDLSATLDVQITPQISSEGFVTLKVLFGLSQFTDPNVDSSNGNRTERKLETSVLLNSNQVLALGGLMREEVTETESRVPVLGSIPLVGWLFKNRTRVLTNTSILILIQAEVLYPISNNPAAARFTQDQFRDSRSLINELNSYSGPRDPINRLFFRDRDNTMEKFVDQFASKDNVYTLDAVEARETAKQQVFEEKPCRYPYRRRRQKQKQQMEEVDRVESLKEVADAEEATQINQLRGRQAKGLAIPKPKKQVIAKNTEDITRLLDDEVPARKEVVP